jgi:hypothetical protein
MANKRKIIGLGALVLGAVLFMAWLAGLLHFGKIAPALAAPRAATPHGLTTRLLQEVNDHFTVQGKPIHPRLVGKFQTYLSDSGPPAVISVDLLAAARDGNEYYLPDVKVRDGLVSYKEPDGSECAYKWLGTVRPGLHVVETFFSGGGTGIFKDLYFFRTAVGTGQDDQGPYDQILMTLVRTPVILGDRDDGTIKVEPGRVIIGKSSYRNQPVVLEFK